MEVIARKRAEIDPATKQPIISAQGVEISIIDDDDMVSLANDKSRSRDDLSLEPSAETLQPAKKAASKSRAKKDRKAAHRTTNPVFNPPFRPAKDILSRIRHDPSLNEAEYVIGYHDRHSPEVLEMDVSVWKGGGDVTDEEWIPQHRIRYFRRKGDEEGRKLWDRVSRLDRVFGSGVVDSIDAYTQEEARGNEATVEQGGVKSRMLVDDGLAS